MVAGFAGSKKKVKQASSVRCNRKAMGTNDTEAKVENRVVSQEEEQCAKCYTRTRTPVSPGLCCFGEL